MRKTAVILALILGMQSLCPGQTRIADDFVHACDSLAVILEDRYGVVEPVSVRHMRKHVHTMFRASLPSPDSGECRSRKASEGMLF